MKLYIVFANLVILSILMLLSFDKLALEMDVGLRVIEFLKIFALLILFPIVWIIYKAVKQYVPNTQHFSELQHYMLAVFLTYSFLYSNYIVQIIDYRIINRQFRQEVFQKVIGHNGSNLTLREYNEIRKNTSLPELPELADSIDFSYNMIDYLVYAGDVSYNMPLDSEINIYKDGEEYKWGQARRVDTLENHLRIYTD